MTVAEGLSLSTNDRVLGAVLWLLTQPEQTQCWPV